MVETGLVDAPLGPGLAARANPSLCGFGAGCVERVEAGKQPEVGLNARDPGVYPGRHPVHQGSEVGLDQVYGARLRPSQR